MVSSLSSRPICTWSRSWRLGTIWFVLLSSLCLRFPFFRLLSFHSLLLEVFADSGFLLQGILNEVWKHKLIFVETPDAAETSIALENYRKVSRPVSSLPGRFEKLKLVLARVGLQQRSRSSPSLRRSRESFGRNRFRSVSFPSCSIASSCFIADAPRPFSFLSSQQLRPSCHHVRSSLSVHRKSYSEGERPLACVSFRRASVR